MFFVNLDRMIEQGVEILIPENFLTMNIRLSTCKIASMRLARFATRHEGAYLNSKIAQIRKHTLLNFH